MVWYARYFEIEELLRYYLPDGRIFVLRRKITYSRSARVNAVCKLFSKIGDICTAGRRRSWFFEGIYSKTTIGFIGYCLIRDLLIDHKHRRSTYIQNRVTNCPIWEHRGMHKYQDYRYEF